MVACPVIQKSCRVGGGARNAPPACSSGLNRMRIGSARSTTKKRWRAGMRVAGGLVADGQQREESDDDDILLLGGAPVVAACVGEKKAVRTTLSPLTCSPLHHSAGSRLGR